MTRCFHFLIFSYYLYPCLILLYVCPLECILNKHTGSSVSYSPWKLQLLFVILFQPIFNYDFSFLILQSTVKSSEDIPHLISSKEVLDGNFY